VTDKIKGNGIDRVNLWEKIDAWTGFLFGKPEGRSGLGRPRCRWEDNTKLDLTETG
jgi:hypothetical protein